MMKFATFFGLKLGHLVFSATEQLSSTLQTHDINAQQAISAANATKYHLQTLRNQVTYETFYKTVVANAEDLTDEPILPRKKKVPQRIDSGAQSHCYASPSEYFRQQYFEVIDTLICELARRFSQPSFSILEEMETVLIDSCNGKPVKTSENFKKFCDGDIDFNRLTLQLSMLPDVLKVANEQYKLGIKKVTLVSTLCEVFNSCDFAKSMLSNVDQLLQIYLTTPMTSATAERTFSTLRRVKSYLRSTMSQKRLNHVIILHTHKQRTDDLDLYEIAKEFASANSRRQDFFGLF